MRHSIFRPNVQLLGTENNKTEIEKNNNLPNILPKQQSNVELVSKELNHLAAILHVYTREFYEVKKIFLLLFFKKKMEILLHF